MRYDVAKSWVSEQEGVRAHARLGFVDKLSIPNVRVLKKIVERVINLLHFALVANMVSNDSCVFLVQWKTRPYDYMISSMSRIFYLWFNPRELPALLLGSIVYDTKAQWCCPLHHPSSTAFVSQNRNHCTTCWILPKAGPKVWFPKVLSRWRSWVGLGVYLLKKKGVVTLPNSTCCLQKCLISMCLVEQNSRGWSREGKGFGWLRKGEVSGVVEGVGEFGGSLEGGFVEHHDFCFFVVTMMRIRLRSAQSWPTSIMD